MGIGFRNLSKTDEFNGLRPTGEDLQTSCLMRIADATEAMAKPFLELLKQLEFERKGRRFLTEENQRLRNRIAGHKAAYTKLKNKIGGQSEK